MAEVAVRVSRRMAMILDFGFWILDFELVRTAFSIENLKSNIENMDIGALPGVGLVLGVWFCGGKGISCRDDGARS